MSKWVSQVDRKPKLQKPVPETWQREWLQAQRISEFGNEVGLKFLWPRQDVGRYRNFGLGAGKRVWYHPTVFPQVLEAKRHHFLRFLGDEDYLATLERLNQRSGIGLLR